VRTDDLAMTPMNNPAGALVYNAHPGLVDTVMVAGRTVKSGGRLVDVDLARIARLADETREHLLQAARTDPSIQDIRLGGTWMPGLVRAQ
jgi:hypothetical protein